MKKIITLIVTFILLFSFTACEGLETVDEGPKKSTNQASKPKKEAKQDAKEAGR